MNRRGFFGLVAGAFAALFVRPAKRAPVPEWHEVGTFYENGHWVTYFPPVELNTGPFLGSQARFVQFKSERLR